jgi:hypothetical protein
MIVLALSNGLQGWACLTGVTVVAGVVFAGG